MDITKSEVSWRDDAEAVWVVDGERKDAVLLIVMDTSEAGGDEEATLVAADESSTPVDAELAAVGDAIGVAVGDMEADVDWIDDAPGLDVTGWAKEDIELAVNWIEDIIELDVTGWAVDITKSEVSWRDNAGAVWVVDCETKDIVPPIVVMETSEDGSDEEAILLATATDERSTLVDATGRAVDDTEAMVDRTKDSAGLEIGAGAVEGTGTADEWTIDIVVAGWVVDVTKSEVSWRDNAETVWVVDGETKDAVLGIVIETSEVAGDEETTWVATDESSTLVDAELATVGDAIGRAVEADIDWIVNAA